MPTNYKNISPYQFMSKIFDDLSFSNFPKFYQDFSYYYLPKILTTIFLVISANFYFFFLFLSEHLSGCPPYPGCPGPFFTFLRIYTYFFDIYLCIFSENSVVGCPLLDARGRRIPRHWEGLKKEDEKEKRGHLRV